MHVSRNLPQKGCRPIRAHRHCAAPRGYAQDKYSSAHFRPYLALDCVTDTAPRSRDKEERIALHHVSEAELRQLLWSGRMNTPSTAFAMLALQWLSQNRLLGAAAKPAIGANESARASPDGSSHRSRRRRRRGRPAWQDRETGPRADDGDSADEGA